MIRLHGDKCLVIVANVYKQKKSINLTKNINFGSFIFYLTTATVNF